MYLYSSVSDVVHCGRIMCDVVSSAFLCSLDLLGFCLHLPVHGFTLLLFSLFKEMLLLQLDLALRLYETPSFMSEYLKKCLPN